MLLGRQWLLKAIKHSCYVVDRKIKGNKRQNIQQKEREEKHITFMLGSMIQTALERMWMFAHHTCFQEIMSWPGKLPKPRHAGSISYPRVFLLWGRHNLLYIFHISVNRNQLDAVLSEVALFLLFLFNMITELNANMGDEFLRLS